MSIQIFKFTFLLPVAMGFTMFFAESVLGDPLSGDEVESLLKELDTIQGVLDGNRLSLRTSAVQTFKTAATSDKTVYEFYLECHKKLKFDARDASFSEFRNWRDANEKKIKTKTNLAAMRLQLQYLVLSLRAAEGVKPDVIVPELESFVANIVSHTTELGNDGMRTLKSPVNRTIFAEAYKLDKSLVMKNWSYTPGNYGSVYDKTIFPYVRTAKPESLAATWDRRINLEKGFVKITKGEDPVAIEKFETEQLPGLYWRKAKDIFTSFSPQHGATSMLQIIKTYPTHQNLNKWVEEFRKLLTDDEEEGTEDPSGGIVPPDKNNPLGFESF